MNKPEQQKLVSRTYPSVEPTEDVDAHILARIVDDPESEDVEGHGHRGGPPPIETEDDVEGHVQPPRDLDIDRF